jgi:MFS transporter, SP family, xylose:H+ symportor
MAKSGFIDQARQVLARIGGQPYGNETLREIQNALAMELQASTSWHEVVSPSVLKILVTGVVLAALQQWSGINIIFNYAEEISQRWLWGERHSVQHRDRRHD